MHPIIIEKLTT